MLADVSPGYSIYCSAIPRAPAVATPAWQTVGGTSAATPLLAGGLALIDEAVTPAPTAAARTDQPAPLHASGRTPALAPAVFNDVTTGTNDIGSLRPRHRRAARLLHRDRRLRRGVRLGQREHRRVRHPGARDAAADRRRSRSRSPAPAARPRGAHPRQRHLQRHCCQAPPQLRSRSAGRDRSGFSPALYHLSAAGLQDREAVVLRGPVRHVLRAALARRVRDQGRRPGGDHRSRRPGRANLLRTVAEDRRLTARRSGRADPRGRSVKLRRAGPGIAPVRP